MTMNNNATSCFRQRFVLPTWLLVTFFLSTRLFLLVDAQQQQHQGGDNDDDVDYTYDNPQQMLIKDENSHRMRRMAASMGKIMTNPNYSNNNNNKNLRRKTYPEPQPHICLALLSCCDRTDLLNHTLAGVIRHMEEDEPDYLRYEIAWVDNGSNPKSTQEIADTYQIEHALILRDNMGLAYGMNLLIFDLCQAPYILLLEEDWLYLDELVALQTPQRKRSIATSVALIEHLEKENLKAYDGRTVMGVFLRHETYESFLSFPHADVWERVKNVNIPKELPGTSSKEEEECSSTTGSEASDTDKQTDSSIADIDYKIFCSDPGLQRESVWGSYTNGAGLYKREHLHAIGRMYGEPGDAFHDRYVEGNYAYRAGLRNCHAALRLTDDTNCTSIFYNMCTGAFHHIGGGRGTRPRSPGGSTCESQAWNFFGTPMYSKYHKYVEEKSGQPLEKCSAEKLKELRDRKFRDLDAKEYREEVQRTNQEVFERERAERDKARDQAKGVLEMLQVNPDGLRAAVPWMQDKSNDEIREMAEKILKLVDSPHPMKGFWDSHGRVVDDDGNEKK